MATRSRVNDIRNRFEGVPVQAPRQRFVSAVDSPAPEVSKEGRAAARKSATKTEEIAKSSSGSARRRRVPAIVAGDTDEQRALKRTAQAKELEIQQLAARLSALTERLARVTTLLDAASSAPVVSSDSRAAAGRIKSTEFVAGGAEARKVVESARAPKVPSSQPSTSLDAILAAARTPRAGNAPSSGKTTQASSNSLEAILAAARGGSSSSGRTTGGTKFSKAMRDFK